MIVLSSATQRTARHDARLIMSFEVLGCSGVCSSSMDSAGCAASAFAFPSELGSTAKEDPAGPSLISWMEDV